LRYVKAFIWLPLVAIWVILDQREPFRSNFGLTILCALASATPVAIVLAIVQRRQKQRDKRADLSTKMKVEEEERSKTGH